MTYPGAGVPNSTGSAWGTSYGVQTSVRAEGSSTDTDLVTEDAVRDLVNALDATPTRDSLGLDTDDSPQFNGVNVGHASDTTITRAEAGKIDVEGVEVVLEGESSLDFLTSGMIAGGITPIVIGNCEGVHDGDANAATLSDSGESLTVDAYIGMTVYNITDASSGTITDNDATTITATLAGGTDNDWDVDDVWAVGPGPKQSGSVFYITAATTIVHPATAGYAAMYYSTGANTIKVDPASASMQFYLDGTATGTNGEELDSAGAAGDFITIHNQSATVGRTMGRSGTWTDGGDS
jgi:hypothetical protein